jgi:RNA ligase (TIGR02306 family)
MSERKMATVRRIDEIRPIKDADSIEAAVIGGWVVVIKKGEFRAGDLAVYLEIDSWVPHAVAPFLSKGQEPREFNGVKGERLRTVKLRGQVSQGLLLPIETAFPGSDRRFWWSQVNVDISERLGIQKWEAPIPASLSGDVEGVFPTVVPKTDQERCLSGETLIDTEYGKISIKDIVSNKMSVKVYSYNHETKSVELKPVIGWSEMTRKNMWVKIKMKSGKELVCTKNHRIWLEVAVFGSINRELPKTLLSFLRAF